MRPTLVLVHRWVGLIFGILLLVQGITGAALVFRDELSGALHRNALTVAPSGELQPVQALLSNVQHAHPEYQVLRIEYPKTAEDAFVFRLEHRTDGSPRIVSVDPYRNRITRDGGLDAWPIQWIFELHHELLSGNIGKQIIGITGVSLLVLVVLGGFIWWPGVRGVRRSLSIKANLNAYRTARDVHRVGGVLVGAILFLSATTGIVMIWKSTLQPVIGISKPSPQVAAGDDAELLPIDAIVAAARARYQQAPVKNVRFPGGTRRVVAVFLRAADVDGGQARQSNQIWLNGYSAQVLGTYEAATRPKGNSFIDWMLPVHTGEVLGILGRVLFLLAALALPGLAITGVWQWTERRRRAARGQAERIPGATPRAR